MHIYETHLNDSLNNEDNTPTRYLLPPCETTVSGICYIYWVVVRGGAQKSISNSGYWQCFCLFYINWYYELFAKDNSYISQWKWRSWAQAYLGLLSVLISVHDTQRYSECFQKSNINTHPATDPEIYNGDLPACMIY